MRVPSQHLIRSTGGYRDLSHLLYLETQKVFLRPPAYINFAAAGHTAAPQYTLTFQPIGSIR